MIYSVYIKMTHIKRHFIDFVGIVKKICDIVEVNKNSNGTFIKRECVFSDQFGNKVSIYFQSYIFILSCKFNDEINSYRLKHCPITIERKPCSLDEGKLDNRHKRSESK